ncbi:MAG: ion transporter [Gemmatimonadetes bacterium]|nr:ion transporter [Gemmatimonadota bacterium]
MANLKRIESCSLDRIRVMKDVVAREIESVNEQLAVEEEKIRRLAESADTVALKKKHGRYELDLDAADSRISTLNEEKQTLEDKARVIDQAFQKKHLMDRQADKLGGVRNVHLKDIIIFFLILFLISILVVDLLGIGANGGGAAATAEVKEGKITNIVIQKPGAGYERVNIHILDNVGSGALVSGHVTGGKLTGVDIVDSGAKYKNPVVEVHPHFSVGTLWIFWIIDVVCCAIFMANFIFEHRLAASKRWYWKNNWIDFITSIPLPPVQVIAASGDLGVVRLGRLLRAVRILRALRLMRIGLFFWRGMDHLSTTLDVRLLKRSLLYGLLSLVFGAVVFMFLEHMESGTGFWQSLWWSFTTLVTGGYADIHNPETASGRILTVFLVITGMVLVGVFTATLTSILVKEEESIQAEELDEQTAIVTKIRKDVEATNQRLDRLEESVQEIRDAVTGREE